MLFSLKLTFTLENITVNLLVVLYDPVYPLIIIVLLFKKKNKKDESKEN